jgi:hypothetical protein
MLAKNLLPIAQSIEKKYTSFTAIFVSLEIASYENSDVRKISIPKLNTKENYSLIVFKSLNRNKIDIILKQLSPDLIFIDGYRVYDQLWTAIGKMNEIPTYKLQQGFEVESVYYKTHSIVTNFYKGLRLTTAVFNISRILNTNFTKNFLRYLLYIFKGKSLRNSFLDNELLKPEIIFVFSEFYKKFWHNKFGFSYEKMEIIMPNDFMLIPGIIEKERINACCYIAQTLVEDGRMRKGEFLHLIREYEKIASKTGKFIIKLHPRSNLSLYDCLKDNPNIEFTRDFPRCSVYLTHYSSLAFTSFFFSNAVILHELPGHPTPELYKNVASLVSNNIVDIESEIIKSIDSEQPDFDKRKKLIEYYASYDSINPFDKIGSVVLKNYPDK